LFIIIIPLAANEWQTLWSLPVSSIVIGFTNMGFRQYKIEAATLSAAASK